MVVHPFLREAVLRVIITTHRWATEQSHENQIASGRFHRGLALAVCGCQTSQTQPAPSLDEFSIYRPMIERKADELGEVKPYTGKHEA
jgi:hypothetical protein